MAGNSFGQLFRLTTFGESHGPAIGGIIDGCPPGMALSEADIQPDLDRRKPGQSRYTSTRKELDQVTILSGVYEGKTTGTPIALLIHNQDQRPSDYSALESIYRPGHADYTYQMKYGVRDPRGGGRASARETAIRVAAGAIAKKYLKREYQTLIRACVIQIGAQILSIEDWDFVNLNPFFSPSPSKISTLEKLLDETRQAGDSLGAKIYVEAQSIPAGWGEPVFDRLDADLAKALISINASKGVEIGDGFQSVLQRGSEHRDLMNESGFLSNHAGGILGGISNGQPITATVAFKPTSSIAQSGSTVTTQGQETTVSTTGRHDPCVGIRAVPIVEAMVALVLMDHAMRQRGQNG